MNVNDDCDLTALTVEELIDRIHDAAYAEGLYDAMDYEWNDMPAPTLPEHKASVYVQELKTRLASLTH